jgi:hypothetical protein
MGPSRFEGPAREYARHLFAVPSGGTQVARRIDSSIDMVGHRRNRLTIQRPPCHAGRGRIDD